MKTSSHIQIMGIISALLLIPLILFAVSYEGVENLNRFSAPDGQHFYLASKAFGLCAFVVLCWQIISALLAKKARTHIRINAGRGLHIILGTTLLLLILMHVITFVAAVSLRSGHLSLDMLVPNFSAGYFGSKIPDIIGCEVIKNLIQYRCTPKTTL